MTDTITLPRAVIEQAIGTIGYYASVVGEDDQDTPAKQTQSVLRAALAQQAEQGWVRVPVEPTPEMINAGRTTPMPSDSEFDEDEDYRAVFIAMVASAPKVGAS